MFGFIWPQNGRGHVEVFIDVKCDSLSCALHRLNAAAAVIIGAVVAVKLSGFSSSSLRVVINI